MDLPNPLQIEFGTGRISVRRFHCNEDFGLVFNDTFTPHKVGSYGNSKPEDGHGAQEGEVYLSFKNKEAVGVIIEELQKLL